MPKSTKSVTNFTSGELSPFVKGRSDISRYENAVEKLENFLILSAGAAQNRPGSKFVGDVKDSSKITRLIPFVFNTEQTYIIELSDLFMRFYTNNGRLVESAKTITDVSQADPGIVTSAGHGYNNGDWVIISDIVGMTELNGKTFIVANSGATFTLQDLDGNDIDTTGFTAYDSGGEANKVVTLASPYTEAQLFDVQFAQTADIMYFAHESHAPRQLVRTSATVFTLSTVAFKGGPFVDRAPSPALTITASLDTGAGITLSASAALWNANHVGALWRIKDGYVKITVFTNSTTVTADVQLNQAGQPGDLNTGGGASGNWNEGAWSVDQGFPGVVSFHEQRIVYARSPGSPQKFWGSAIRTFDDFFDAQLITQTASDSYNFTIATEQVNVIRWLSSGKKALNIGTFGGNFSASSGSTNVPITPTNIVVQRDTTYGAASILPERIGNFVYYIQRNLKVMRELGFNFDIDDNIAADMTLLSDQILGVSGAKQLAYQQAPGNILWAVRADGEVATLTRQQEQEVIGWSRQIFGGAFQTGIAVCESVVVIPGLAGDDQVWVITKRTINGTTRRYVEFIMPQTFDDQDDSFFVDSGLSLDVAKTITGATKANPVVITSNGHGFSNGDQIKIVDVVGMTELNGNSYLVASKTPNTFELQDLSSVNINGLAFTTYITGGEVREMVLTVSGLDHLEGETVAIYADGVTQDQEVVSSGAVTISSKAAKIHVGLPYVPEINGLPLVDGSATGTGRTKERKVYIATLILKDTLGIQFGRGNVVDSLVLNGNTALFTGDKQVGFPAGWDRIGQYVIKQPTPQACTILGLVLRSDVQDK